jgi:predicted acylesterase/phospholipase RssA
MDLRTLATTVGDRTKQVRTAVVDDARRTAQAVWSRTHVLMFVPLGAAVALGRWLEVSSLYIAVFSVVSSVWGVVLYGRAKDAWQDVQRVPEESDAAAVWRRQTRWGIVEGTLVAVVVIVAVFDRVLWPTQMYWLVGSGVTVALVGLRSWRSQDPRQQLHPVILRLVVEPFVVAWFLVSAFHAVTLIDFGQGRTAAESGENERRREELARRATVMAARNRLGPVAVTLSGGGYRAAVTQAGALWVLDQIGVPIDLLSTVSGGSVLGANYAAGVNPESFIQTLCRRKPGLPMVLVNFGPVLAQVFLPGLNSGDTYAWHFNATYFRGAKLKETGPPTLILNSTRYDTGTRAAFWPPMAGELTLARGVAASGAFPGAFDPVRIDNATRDGKPTFFVDGGTAENLGVDGLWAYLRETTSAKAPDVIIMIDMSKDPTLGPAAKKPAQLTALLGAQDIVYRSLHQRIFDRYSGGGYGPLAGDSTAQRGIPVTSWTVRKDEIWPFTRERPRPDQPDLAVVIVRPTAAEERALYPVKSPLAERVEAVAKLGTLAELEPSQITDAVWFGAKAMLRRLPVLRARTELPLTNTPDLVTTPKCTGTERPVDSATQ